MRRSRFAGALSLEGRWAFLRRPGAWWLAALALGAAARVFFVLASEGTYDVGIWEGHARGVAERGLIDTYEHGNRFNHPPPIGLLIGFLHGLAARLGVDFAVLLRAPFALLDAGTALLLLRILRGHPARWALSALYWLHPLAILYSGYHGNTDSAVAFFLLAATAAATGTRGNRGAVAAGVCLGLGAWVKLPVVLGAPALFFALPGRGQRLRLAAAASVVALVGFAPALAEDAGRVVQSVFLYGGQNLQSTAGVKVWGLQNLWPEPASMPYAVRGGYAAFLAGLARWNALIATLPLLVLAWLRRGERSPAAVGATIGLCYATFYALTNAWAFQYFAWSLPCWLLLGRRSAWALSVAATLYIWALYMWLTGHPLLLGEWDFVGHRHWPFPILLLRDACVLTFAAVAAVGFAAGIRRVGRTTRGASAAALLAATLTVLGCGGETRGRAPLQGYDLLIVNVDTLRADHLGCHGYARDTSPFIDSLAAEGVVFERATSNSSFTRESVASLFTGRLASTSGGLGWNAAPPPGLPTLGERLSEAGYATGFMSNSVMLRHPGFTRGFTEVQHLPRRWGLSGEGPRLTERALEFARAAARQPERPFALYLHYLDPHGPYSPAPVFRARIGTPEPDLPLALYDDVIPRAAELAAEGFGVGDPRFDDLVARYDAEISATDAALEQLFEGLRNMGRLDGLLVVLTADHGEEFSEHGGWEHGWTLYQESIHVPLIFWAPGALPPARVKVRASHVDVLPTLAALLGLDPGDAPDGRPLLRPEADLAPVAEERAQIAELLIPRRNMVRAVLLDDWKYVAAQRWRRAADRVRDEPPAAATPVWSEPVREELFHLSEDPGETEAVEETPAALAELQRALAALRARSPNLEIRPPAGTGIDPEEAERLKALGYH